MTVIDAIGALGMIDVIDQECHILIDAIDMMDVNRPQQFQTAGSRE